MLNGSSILDERTMKKRGVVETHRLRAEIMFGIQVLCFHFCERLEPRGPGDCDGEFLKFRALGGVRSIVYVIRRVDGEKRVSLLGNEFGILGCLQMVGICATRGVPAFA